MTRPEPRDREGRTLNQYIADQVRTAVLADPRTIRQIAQEAGLGHMTLYRNLNEQREFKVNELSHIAEVLGVHVAALVRLDLFDAQ